MNEGSGALVVWILVPLFVAVGLYLIWYSRRRKKMLEAFAKAHQFRIRPDRQGQLQKTLDSCFSLTGKGLVRSFGQLSSLVEAGPIWLFRAVELLDLNPHARSYSTHFARIVALFDVSTRHDEFFVLDKSMRVSQRLPGSKSPDSNVVGISKEIAKSCKARHLLSVTLARGHGVIYFEPLVTGGETIADVHSLYCIAKNMSERLCPKSVGY
jgi:hypothetical protein